MYRPVGVQAGGQCVVYDEMSPLVTVEPWWCEGVKGDQTHLAPQP